MRDRRRLMGWGGVVVGVILVGIGHEGRATGTALRLVQFDIALHGKVVLKASTGDKGTQGPDVVWRYLDHLELRPEKGFRVQPDADDPLRATLSGAIRIEARYGGTVTVESLELVRERADLPWRVAPAEVERTFDLRTRPG
ncbi:hypothetical protein [Tautonia rosea]|uniref:hypothetical protein n=1 Tax=Tautonia rosea TaxID=2728037 RepID=UPI001472D45D|nr:hypothetical protein [Tautonia rosea]